MAKNEKLNDKMRILYFISGMIILSALMIYAFSWETMPFRISILNYDITEFALAPMLILIGFFGSSMVKSGLTGKKSIDI